MIGVVEYKQLMESGTMTGVYMYSNGCHLCKKMEDKLKQFGIRVIAVIDCLTDTKYFLEQGFDKMPAVVLWINGEQKFIKTGEMFDLQLEQFKQYLESFV